MRPGREDSWWDFKRWSQQSVYLHAPLKSEKLLAIYFMGHSVKMPVITLNCADVRRKQ